jgi:hypothetical protein
MRAQVVAVEAAAADKVAAAGKVVVSNTVAMRPFSHGR